MLATYPFSLPATQNKFDLKITLEILLSMLVLIIFFARLSVCRVVLHIPRERHARLVAHKLATRQNILTCRDGLKVANILMTH